MPFSAFRQVTCLQCSASAVRVQRSSCGWQCLSELQEVIGQGSWMDPESSLQRVSKRGRKETLLLCEPRPFVDQTLRLGAEMVDVKGCGRDTCVNGTLRNLWMKRFSSRKPSWSCDGSHLGQNRWPSCHVCCPLNSSVSCRVLTRPLSRRRSSCEPVS